MGTTVRAASIIRTEVRPDRVCVLTLDDPGETHNTAQLAAALEAALEAADRDPRVKAVVLRSGKPDSFRVGANLDYLRTIRFAKDAEVASLEVSKRFGRIAQSRKPVVACVHGATLGGGFELSLACTATVATGDRATLLGLPEVKLGLMPAANGLLRVAQRAGLGVAIDLGLTGRSVSTAEALAHGFVDEVVPPAEALAAACRLALQLARRPDLRRALPRRRAWLRHRGSLAARVRVAVMRLLLEQNPVGRILLFRRARAAAEEETRGHYPAAGRMLDVLAGFGGRGFASAAKLEAKLFGELVVSETSHRLVELFFATAAAEKDPGVEHDERARAHARPVTKIAVIGAGLMGAGIAHACIQAGSEVRLTDTEPSAVERGLAYVKDVVVERERRGKLTSAERTAMVARLSGGRDYEGVEDADLVIEAVFEDLDRKRAVLRDLEARVKPTCVIASNTSALRIARIAEAAARPERVLGMHYCGPVERGPLLEVVRAARTDPAAIATAVAVGRRQGKNVIVVRDGTGFYTTRILAPFLNEAAIMLTEGVAISTIDDALVDWGFPTGPLHMLDAMGIDLAAHVASTLEAAYGARLAAPRVLAALGTDDRKGRKNGRGFYLYGRGPNAGRRVDDTVYQAFPIRPLAKPMPDEISLRCTMALVNEALRCLDENILRSPRDGDVGAIFGLGFPPFRGGPFRYLDVIGPPEILRRTRSLEQRFGARFEPAPLLVEMARKGKRFYG